MRFSERYRHITQGVARSPRRAMYYALGYQKSDFDKPMIGIANGHFAVTLPMPGPQPLWPMTLDEMSSGWAVYVQRHDRFASDQQLYRCIFRVACRKEVMLAAVWEIYMRLYIHRIGLVMTIVKDDGRAVNDLEGIMLDFRVELSCLFLIATTRHNATGR